MNILYAVISAIIQAIGYTILKKSLKETTSSVSFFFDMAFGILIWVPYSLLTGIDFENISKVFPWAFVSAVLSEAFIFYVFSKCELSLGNTIFATYSIFTIWFSKIINKENLSAEHFALIILCVLGIIIISFPEESSKQEFKKKFLLLYPLAGALTVGLSDTLSKGIINTTNSSTFLFCLAFCQIPISLIYLKLERQKLKNILNIIKNAKSYLYSILAGLITVLSLIFFWLAFEKNPASIASPITATYSCFVILFSYIFLKEKIILKNAVGIVLILGSVLSISLF